MAPIPATESEGGFAPGVWIVIDDFDSFYEQQFQYVWRLLGRLGVAEADLPDAVHEVFVVVYRKRADYDAERPARAWLFGIARRVAAAMRRKRSREVAAPMMTPRDNTSRADDRLSAHQQLWLALEVLNETQREAFVLHDLEGYSGPEIAAQLDLPVDTVYSRVRVARKRVERRLQRIDRGETCE